MTVRSIYNHFVYGDTLEIKLEKELIVVWLLLVTGSGLFHFTEWRSYFDSLYFCIITLTSVGYGDLVPVTMVGKTLTMIFALTALPLYIYTMKIIIEDKMISLKDNQTKRHIKRHEKTLQK